MSLAIPCKWYNGLRPLGPRGMRGMLPMHHPVGLETLIFGTTVL